MDIEFQGGKHLLKTIGTSFDFQRKTLDLIVDTVKRLRYCDGVTDGDYKTTLKYFGEQATKVVNILIE